MATLESPKQPILDDKAAMEQKTKSIWTIGKLPTKSNKIMVKCQKCAKISMFLLFWDLHFLMPWNNFVYICEKGYSMDITV